VWSGWGRAGDVGARRQVEVGEEGADEVARAGSGANGQRWRHGVSTSVPVPIIDQVTLSDCVF